jgi:sterol desaturase/sphingolipid hydroxylase (fatty acid hydroxylase superfamily)
LLTESTLAPPRQVAPTKGATWRIEWMGVMAITSLVVWLGYIGTHALLSTHSLGAALSEARGTMTAPALFIVVAVIFGLERVWPAVSRPARARAHVIDASYFVLFAAVVGPLLVLVETGLAQEIHRYLGAMQLSQLPAVPRLAAALVILAAIDVTNWACHVANHKSRTMWRLHALHHSQEDMSVFTTFRTHPMVHATYLPALLPALFLGASGTVPAIALIVYGCLVTLPHANLPWSFGPVGRVLVSPAFHRLHHETNPTGGKTVNFGFVLTIWDRLARTARFPVAGVTVTTGIAGRPVPLEQEVGVPAALVGQLTQPFRRLAATDGA